MQKAIYSNLITNSKLNGENAKSRPLKLETRKGFPLFLYLSNIIPEILDIAIRQLKGIKEIQVGKKTSKYCYLQII